MHAEYIESGRRRKGRHPRRRPSPRSFGTAKALGAYGHCAAAAPLGCRRAAGLVPTPTTLGSRGTCEDRSMDHVDRDEIRELLDQGLSTAEIAARLGVSAGRVAAVKAHLTMGTYDASRGRSAGIYLRRDGESSPGTWCKSSAHLVGEDVGAHAAASSATSCSDLGERGRSGCSS